MGLILSIQGVCDSFYHTYLYKRKIWSKSVYYWVGSVQSWLFSLERIQNRFRCCRRFIFYFTTSFLLSDSSMKCYRYSVGQIFRGIPFLVPTVENVAARIRHATSMDTNHPRFLRVSILKRKFHIRDCSQDLLLCGTDTSEAACMNTSILILSSIITSRFNSPASSIPFISNTSFRIIILLILTLCLEWLQG